SGRTSNNNERGYSMAKYAAKKFRSDEIELAGISKKAMEEHYKLYQGYVGKANEILDRLASGGVDLSKANPTYSEFRELKVELSRALGGIKNHEVYFNHLGAKGGKPGAQLLGLIEKAFGSFDGWQARSGDVGKANEILDRLASGGVDLSKANPTYSEFRELKVELSRALGGIKNHEVYFNHLGAKGGKPGAQLLGLIEKAFGSFDGWQA